MAHTLDELDQLIDAHNKMATLAISEGVADHLILAKLFLGYATLQTNALIILGREIEHIRFGLETLVEDAVRRRQEGR